LVVECAWSIISMRGNPLAEFYWKTKQRRGSKKAIIATARKLLVLIYCVLRYETSYDETRYEATRQKQEELRMKRLVSDANKYGFKLVPICNV